MDKADILKRLERIETNAGLLLKEAAILREELSGGSDSSNLKNSLPHEEILKIIAKRKKVHQG